MQDLGKKPLQLGRRKPLDDPIDLEEVPLANKPELCHCFTWFTNGCMYYKTLGPDICYGLFEKYKVFIMKTQICNNCGNNIGLLEKIHLFEGKGVCGDCIKILDPQPEKPKINYAKIAVEAVDRATVQIADDEDARYEKAKRRCVFFFSGIIWFIQLVILFMLMAMVPLVFILIGIWRWLF